MATARRSIPKATQAVWAGSTAASAMSQVVRGLATEAIGGDVERQTADRHRAAARRDRIDGIAGGRRQHEVGRRQRRGPVSPGIEAADRYVNLAFRAVQAADATQQVREA